MWAWAPFIQYGAIGAGLVFLGLFAWKAYQRETLRADSAEDRLHSVEESVRTDLVPAVTRSTEAAVRMTELLPDVIAALSTGRRRS
jgi:hypothetical protein